MEAVENFIKSSTKEEWERFLQGIKNQSNSGSHKKAELELVLFITQQDKKYDEVMRLK